MNRKADFFYKTSRFESIRHYESNRIEWNALLDTVKARKLAHCRDFMRKQGNEIMQGTMPGSRRRGRPCTAWMDNIKTWTGLSVEESVRVTEDRDKWRKYVHGMAVATAKEHNRTLCLDKNVHRSLTRSIINWRTETGRNGRRKLASAFFALEFCNR